MLRFCYIILVLLYDVAKGRDIEVQARVRLDPDFMKRMEKSLRVETAILRASNSINNEVPGGKPETDNFIYKGVKPQFSRNNDDDKSVTELHEERLEKKGIESIQSVADYIRLKFNFTLDESLVRESCELYAAKLKSYFKFMSAKESSFDVEPEDVVIAKIDMAVTLQSSLERTLLEEALAKYKNISNSEKYIMTEGVVLFTMRNKQNEIKYVCHTMGICRPYPGYSDYFAKILSEVLKLYDIKFQYFTVKSAQLIVSKKTFLKTILRDEIFEYLSDKAKDIVDANMDDMRERLSVLRSVITERHKLVNAADEAVKSRTKATRIVIDIIDAVFDKVGMAEVEIRADAVVTGIQDWAANLLTDIEPILSIFISDSATKIKYELSHVGKEEMKVLADIIYFGEPKGNQGMAKYLMTKGSKFIDGGEKSYINDFLKLTRGKKEPQIA